MIDPEFTLTNDIEAKILTATKAAAMHMTHDIAGDRLERIILEYDTKEKYTQMFGKLDKVTVKIADQSYDMLRVMVSDFAVKDDFKSVEERQKDLKDSKVIPKHIRKLKNFSGITPVPAGESTCDEWVSLAQDMIDYDLHLNPVEKFYIMRNSLVKDALTLISSSTLDFNPQELVNTIMMTYGYSHSAEHLTYEFHKVEQKDLEKPSSLSTRLQTLGNRIKRLDDKFNLDVERFRQFKFALCAHDYELFNTHFALEQTAESGHYPSYGSLLQQIQVFERDKRERMDRNKHAGVCSALVSVQETQSVSTLKAAPSTQVQTAAASGATIASTTTKTDETEARVLATTMQSNDSHASNQFNNTNKQRFNQADNSKFQRKDKPKRTVQCYNCNQEGHRYSKCPKPFDKDVFGENFKKAQDRQKEYDSRQSGKN